MRCIWGRMSCTPSSRRRGSGPWWRLPSSPLAAIHRQRSVPALVARLEANFLIEGDALTSLRASLWSEALIGFAVLAVVAWLGTLSPPG